MKAMMILAALAAVGCDEPGDGPDGLRQTIDVERCVNAVGEFGNIFANCGEDEWAEDLWALSEFYRTNGGGQCNEIRADWDACEAQIVKVYRSGMCSGPDHERAWKLCGEIDLSPN